MPAKDRYGVAFRVVPELWECAAETASRGVARQAGSCVPRNVGQRWTGVNDMLFLPRQVTLTTLNSAGEKKGRSVPAIAHCHLLHS